MGQVMGGGKNHYSYQISENHFKENELGIKAEVLKAFLSRGWQCEVTTMLLPPSRGVQGPSSYLQMTRDALPIFMVLRVSLQSRHWRQVYACDCSDIIPFYRHIDTRECEAIGRELQETLQQSQYMRSLRRPIKAEISVVDAAGEMHVLYDMHWSEEQAADYIVRSRRQASAAGAGGHPPQSQFDAARQQLYNAFGGNMQASAPWTEGYPLQSPRELVYNAGGRNPQTGAWAERYPQQSPYNAARQQQLPHSGGWAYPNPYYAGGFG